MSDCIRCGFKTGGETYCAMCRVLNERDQLRADVKRLRALCAARPNGITFVSEYGVDTEDEERWIKQIDAAGRGEG